VKLCLTQCIDRALLAVDASSNIMAGKVVLATIVPLLSTVVISIVNAYLEKLLKNSLFYFFNIGSYDNMWFQQEEFLVNPHLFNHL
jgi:hypothetical protein